MRLTNDRAYPDDKERRLLTVFGVFPTFSDDIPDVKRFAQVNWLKSLTLEGKCFCRRAKPAHIGGHLPAGLEVMERILDELLNQAQKTGEKENRRGTPAHSGVRNAFASSSRLA